jgi:hypothetical protein
MCHSPSWPETARQLLQTVTGKTIDIFTLGIVIGIWRILNEYGIVAMDDQSCKYGTSFSVLRELFVPPSSETANFTCSQGSIVVN